MALTETQKKWATGGSIGAGVLFIGYLLFRSRPAHAGSFLPGGQPHEGHAHRKKHRRPEGQDGEVRENERGEYGRKKKQKRHHRKREHE